ncbi:hypothetical protein KA005_83735, partial [bacterium]|nr:hypothetical protein [bacterium]
MKRKQIYQTQQIGSRFVQIICLAMLMLAVANVAVADVSYYIYGRAFSVHQTVDEVESEATE